MLPQARQAPGMVVSSGNSVQLQIRRLRESLEKSEERRRLEAAHYENQLRQMEAELEQTRVDGDQMARLCQERDSEVNYLRSELIEVEAARDIYRRQRDDANDILSNAGSSYPMRQRSRPSPGSAERSSSSRVKRGNSEPPRRDARPSSHDASSPSAAIAAAVSAATAAAGARDGHGSARGLSLQKGKLSSLDEERGSPHEVPIEINISVPRVLSPEELEIMREQAAAEEVQSQVVQPQQHAALTRLWSTPHSLQAHARTGVSRQVSAPYAPSDRYASSGALTAQIAAAAEQGEGRWMPPGPPPVTRMSSAQLPQQVVTKPGSATIPTASGLGAVTLAPASGPMLHSSQPSQPRLAYWR